MYVTPKRDMHVPINRSLISYKQAQSNTVYERNHAKLAIFDTHNFQPLYIINK